MRIFFCNESINLCAGCQMEYVHGYQVCIHMSFFAQNLNPLSKYLYGNLFGNIWPLLAFLADFLDHLYFSIYTSSPARTSQPSLTRERFVIVKYFFVKCENVIKYTYYSLLHIYKCRFFSEVSGPCFTQTEQAFIFVPHLNVKRFICSLL